MVVLSSTIVFSLLVQVDWIIVLHVEGSARSFGRERPGHSPSSPEIRQLPLLLGLARPQTHVDVTVQLDIIARAERRLFANGAVHSLFQLCVPFGTKILRGCLCFIANF
eukprot:scaffold34646_cov173-Amphora_coffeaeformis.AAC.1